MWNTILKLPQVILLCASIKTAMNSTGGNIATLM